MKFADQDTITRIRLHIADPSGDLLTDAEINAIYNANQGDTARSIADLLRVIAASELLISKKIRTQDLSTDGPAVAAELRAQAREWDRRAADEEDVPVFTGYAAPAHARGGRLEAEEARTWWV